MDDGERGYLELKLSMADLEAQRREHQARVDELEKIQNRTAKEQKQLDYHKGWVEEFIPRRMKTYQDGLPSFPYGETGGSKSKSPTQGAMNRCPKPGSNLEISGFVGLPLGTETTTKIGQTYTLKGTATTKSDTQVATTKLSLPTVTTGYMVDPQHTPEAFLAGSVVGNQGGEGSWSAEDKKPSAVLTNMGGSSLPNLQVALEVRFITVQDRFFDSVGVDFVDKDAPNLTDKEVARSSVSETGDSTGIFRETGDSTGIFRETGDSTGIFRETGDSTGIFQGSAGTSKAGGTGLGSQVLIDVRFLTVTDDFFERIGVDFDFTIHDQASGVSSPKGENAKELGAFSEVLEGYSYTYGVGYGYDVGLINIPLTSLFGRQLVDLGALVINDNPSRIFGMKDGVNPWAIVNEVEGSGLPIGGWTHAALPFGTTLGWQPEGDAGVLDDFISQHGDSVAYTEHNAGTAGAPAPWDTREWPNSVTHPIPHLQLQKNR